MTDETSPASGTQAASPMERAFYDILLRDQRIAELEAQVARLTAPVTEEDLSIVERINAKWYEHVLPEYARDLLAALLERRIKGC